MSQVYMQTVSLGDLQDVIQKAKDAGQRILAISPKKMTKIGRTPVYEVVEFTLITQ